jgi:TolB-like protein/DNA-binding winged helix-turn-helix (wHTH) protein/Tfp pilus assembly protein PilF
MPPDAVVLANGLELDRSAYELRRGGSPLKLSRTPMEVLLLLVERRGELVTRDEIAERIWGKNVFVDRDNNINAAIRKLRQVLEDDPEKPKFVQTVTGRGYRFISAVPEAGNLTALPAGGSDPVLLTDVLPASRIRAAIPHPRVRRLWLLLPCAAIALILGVVAYFHGSRLRTHPQTAVAQTAVGRVMLAVLPFKNLTGDAAQDYFSDGLTEEMIAQLGNLDPPHLGVIARTSVMHYKGSNEKLDQIGSELRVQYVLEGSVRRSSDKIRITAQLIQIRDQTHVWARQYDRELSDLLALQGEIAQEVAEEIPLGFTDPKAAISAHQPLLGPQAYEAYDLYLKGRYFWNKRTPRGFQQAIECFQRSIAKDPKYARAYAGLADTYALLSGYTLTPQTESMPKARAAALKALELDESLAEAHTSLALITENYDWDWKTAEKEYRRAIELNPNYATAHHWYAEFLSWEGRFDEAFAESERARQLDPLSLIIAADNAAILFYSRQYDRAIAQCRSVQEMEPNFPRAHLVVGAYVEKGQFANALADLDKWEDAAWTLSWRIYIYGRHGQQPQARRALEKLHQLNRREYISPDAFLWAYLGMGNKDEAFAWFERAYADHSNSLISLKVNPAYDPLRSDPRFQDLMRRVGLDSN